MNERLAKRNEGQQTNKFGRSLFCKSSFEKPCESTLGDLPGLKVNEQIMEIFISLKKVKIKIRGSTERSEVNPPT